MRGLIFWSCYFAPTLIAWFRARQGKAIVNSMGQLFLFNLLIGWTVIGWFLVLANAFGLNPVAWAVPRLVKVLPAGRVGNRPQGNAVPSYGPGTDSPRCTTCGGSGQMTCPTCRGQRGHWETPQTAEGTSRWLPCSYCISSGTVQCTSGFGHG
jgi:hypothetical protein